MELEEVQAQPYTNCVISAGIVHDNESVPEDTIYLRFSREGEEPTTIMLRPDEALAVTNCLSGALWSHDISMDGITNALYKRIESLERRLDKKQRQEDYDNGVTRS